MIHLYYFPTPNGQKISILLNELGVPYQLHTVNITQNEQFHPDFLKISPNNKIPALVDDEVLHNGQPLTIFESGAILIYLAEKYQKFYSTNPTTKAKINEWLFWQVGGVGPIFGQLGFFHVRAAEKNQMAIQRFYEESVRLLNVMEKHLTKNKYLAGDEYTIADMATFPWVAAVQSYIKDPLASDLQKMPAVLNWIKNIGQRPTVEKALRMS